MDKYILCGKLIENGEINSKPHPHIPAANYHVMAKNNCKNTYQHFFENIDNLPVFICGDCEKQEITPFIL